jgi:hypothetical protein
LTKRERENNRHKDPILGTVGNLAICFITQVGRGILSFPLSFHVILVVFICKLPQLPLREKVGEKEKKRKPP